MMSEGGKGVSIVKDGKKAGEDRIKEFNRLRRWSKELTVTYRPPSTKATTNITSASNRPNPFAPSSIKGSEELHSMEAEDGEQMEDEEEEIKDNNDMAKDGKNEVEEEEESDDNEEEYEDENDELNDRMSIDETDDSVEVNEGSDEMNKTDKNEDRFNKEHDDNKKVDETEDGEEAA
ncbi:hypothetical protein Dimus_024291 [Dionaea muscipula]